VWVIAILKQYLREYNALNKRADHIRTQLLLGWLKIYATESLVSAAWQLWNDTCKKILLASCSGCTGRNRIFYPARACDNSLERIAYEVQQYSKMLPVKAGKKLYAYWNHPTWGDGSKIIHTISGLQPSNANTLITAFGLPLHGHKNLQTIRNFSAHKNDGTLLALKNLQCFTGQSLSTHPSCYILEYCTQTNSFYYNEWMSDMKHIIYHATA